MDHLIIAQLNARVQPIDRGDYFEDPLQETLEKTGFGEVTGGGTQMTAEPAGIAFCELEICAANYSDDVIKTLIDRLNELGAPKGSKLILLDEEREIPFGVNEGLAIFLNGTELPDHVYETLDVNHVIEECGRLLEGRGNFRGYWQGSLETGLYFYGASYDDMRSAVEPFVETYPLCQRARLERIA